MVRINAKHDCKYFNGYKPCEFKRICNGCSHYEPMGKRLLVVHLGAMGAVLASTAILPVLKKKYPRSQISWLTEKASLPLLENNPFIDRLLCFDNDSVSALLSEKFDYLLSADKESGPASLASRLKATQKHGFGWSEQGNVLPLSERARYSFELGLDDELKFKRNTKSLPQLFTELGGLRWRGEEYVLELSSEERAAGEEYRRRKGIKAGDFVVGFNTGCAELFPYKKLSLKRHVEVIRLLLREVKGVKVLLLGGRSETRRNREIAAPFRGKVIQTPTEEGLRAGIVYEDCCHLVVSGDSLGMHIAIALRKLVVAWFGLTCEQEIELYGRGEKLLSEVSCRPCWRRECEEKVKCFDKVSAQDIVKAITQLKAKHGAG